MHRIVGWILRPLTFSAPWGRRMMIAVVFSLLVFLGSRAHTQATAFSTANVPPQLVTGVIAFQTQIIGENVDQAHSMIAADLDGDGDLDVAATDHVDGLVFWYEHDGAGGFVEHLLDPNLRGAYPSHVDDVDQDGDPDLFAGGYNSDTYVWYRNDGGGAFTRIDIDTAADGAHSLVTADLDKDGDIDLITADQDSNSIAWYENDGANQFTRQLVDGNSRAAKRTEVADMNGDGELDLVTAAFDSNEIAWYENDGRENFSKRVISSNAEGAYYVAPADLDGDGDNDVFSASQLDHTIAWHENKGAAGFTTHVINAHARAARTVVATDIDGDGDMDGVSASVNDDTVAWYRNDGLGNFTELIIDDAADGAYGLFTIDMNGDGAMDVFSAGKFSNQIVLHKQVRVHRATMARGGTLLLDATRLQSVDPDTSPAEILYTITQAPTDGAILRAGVGLVAGGTFTQDDINKGRVRYAHAGQGAVDEFEFSVRNGVGGGQTAWAAATGIFAIRLTEGTPAPLPASDDFYRCAMNDALWTWSDPRGDSTYALQDKRVVIEVPAGASHDLWPGSTNAPRLFQSVRDEDFAVTARFDTLPTGKNQLQGLVVSGDADHLLRFDIHSFDGGTRLFVATIEEGEAIAAFSQLIAPDGEDGISLRLLRQEDQWAAAYSFNDIDWQPVGTFRHELAVDAVGLFAGNAGENPAFTARVDYFEVATDPIANEDAAPLAPRLLESNGGTVHVEPVKSTYACGELLTLRPQPEAGHTFVEWTGDLSGRDVPLVVPFEIGLTVGARFQSPQTPARHQLAVMVGAGGTVELSPPGGEYDAGTVVTLTAVPDANQRFIGWSGDLSAAVAADPTAATIVLIMDRDRTVSAQFGPAGGVTPSPSPSPSSTQTPMPLPSPTRAGGELYLPALMN